ncbi:hypothetical protein DFJ73DRAFT_824423 [Zopfochytrium polystomum]|nr:hypothetical protein DFJ73DRAFT_824423 [Zopfochytrium polystomum]
MLELSQVIASTNDEAGQPTDESGSPRATGDQIAEGLVAEGPVAAAVDLEAEAQQPTDRVADHTDNPATLGSQLESIPAAVTDAVDNMQNDAIHAHSDGKPREEDTGKTLELLPPLPAQAVESKSEEVVVEGTVARPAFENAEGASPTAAPPNQGAALNQQQPLSRPLGPDEIATDLSQWYRKRYLGGFRNKKTGVEYFHAFSQTPTAQEIKDAKAAPKFHRDTQTKYLRNRLAQSKRDEATQMEKPGLHISSEADYFITPRPYFSAEDHHRMIVQKKEQRRKRLAEKKRKKEIESRLHPKSTKDFDILYNGLENWRLQETEKINNANYSEPARLAALADLMDQEAVLIQKIDKLRSVASEENRERRIVKLLEKMASPKRWPVYKGGVVLVDTPNTIRARELRDLFHALNVAILSVDERLQILLHVKYTVKEFDCNLTREIVELIDREGDLVSRGRDPKSLEGLRKRISNLFLHFIETPEFNPEAALYQKFPEAGQSWKRDQAVYYCRGCTKYLPSTDFYLSTTMKHLGRCKSCTIRENLATKRQDDGAYAEMLHSVRAAEAARRAAAAAKEGEDGVAEDPHYNAMNLMQEADMRHLVESIWGRQSCIGGGRNLEDLVLVRWDAAYELTPWNCLLLTRAEANRHEAGVGGEHGVDPEELYTDDFVRSIRGRHLAGRRYFSQLPAMEKYIARKYVEDASGKLVPISRKLEIR